MEKEFNLENPLNKKSLDPESNLDRSQKFHKNLVFELNSFFSCWAGLLQVSFSEHEETEMPNLSNVSVDFESVHFHSHIDR